MSYSRVADSVRTLGNLLRLRADLQPRLMTALNWVSGEAGSSFTAGISSNSSAVVAGYSIPWSDSAISLS